jgi:RND family efflux transporter MFP subunit
MKIVQRIKKHPYFSALIAVVIIYGGYYWYSHRAVPVETKYVVSTAEKQTLISSVSGTGQVSTLNKIDLKSQTGGQIVQMSLVQMNVKLGQQVPAGYLVAKVDDTSALVSLQQAEANLTSAQANYDKVVNGATDTDIAASRRSVSSAQISLDNAKNNLASVTQQQNTAVANSLHNLLSTGVEAVLANWPYTSPNVTESDAPIITGSYSGTATGTYHIVQQGSYFSATGLENVPLQKIDINIPAVFGNNGLYVQFKNTNISAQWDIAIPNPQASSYVSNLSSYQSALFNQQQALSSAKNQVSSAELALQNAQDSLAKLLSPPEAQTVASAKAQLINAQAQLRTARSNYDNTRVIAPFAGQIAAVNAQKGDQVTNSTVIATLVTQQKIATVSLNEVDAAKIKLGNDATLTFDALPGLSITGKVSQIDLLGTVTQGIVSYNVQIVFDTQDERVKSGMSVSATIIEAVKTDVIAVPSTAVKKNGDQLYVYVVEDSNIATKTGNIVTLKTDPKIQNVTVGISSNSMTEISEGLSENEVVISRTVTAQTQAAQSGSQIRIPGLGGGGNFR